MMKNPFSLAGKSILVTGASSGIGKATAMQCAEMGASLVVTGRNKERLEEVFSSLSGCGHSMVVADLTEEEGIESLIKQLPPLDGAVLAAGIVELWPVVFATRKRIEKIYKTNLFSPIELLRLIVKRKLYNKGMSVVVIDSIAGTSDFCSGNSIYGSGKAALASFAKYAAYELSSKSLRVNTISPGMIQTPMHSDETITKEQLEKMISTIPLKRWGEAEDVAYGAVYLLSDASSYVTGTDLCIDGGFTL